MTSAGKRYYVLFDYEQELYLAKSKDKKGSLETTDDLNQAWTFTEVEFHRFWDIAYKCELSGIGKFFVRGKTYEDRVKLKEEVHQHICIMGTPVHLQDNFYSYQNNFLRATFKWPFINRKLYRLFLLNFKFRTVLHRFGRIPNDTRGGSLSIDLDKAREAIGLEPIAHKQKWYHLWD